jgi:hypothetical protein
MIQTKRILIDRCTAGIYLRWWFNGWHYYCFNNRYSITMQTASADTMVTQLFSVVSKIERPTKVTAEYTYRVELVGVRPQDADGFTGLLLAERVEQYEGGNWYVVDIVRESFKLLQAGAPAYSIVFTVTRKELPLTAAVYQKTQSFYIGETLAELDDDEIIPINKQVNDIAEMQDRQSDFTAQFKVRKSRAMRALFELSGEVGASTNFPYEQQVCRLVQDGIEIISNGRMVLDRIDDQYYYVSVYSGNLNFFKTIENSKVADLPLAGTNHYWFALTAQISQSGVFDYIYPLCEPSNDGGLTPLTDDGDRVELYCGWVWPHVKVKAIWDDIFTAAGFTCTGDILTDTRFLGLHMPIATLQVPKALSDRYLYSMYWRGSQRFTGAAKLLTFTGAVLINGTELFRTGYYNTPYAATYRIRVELRVQGNLVPTLTLRNPSVTVATFELVQFSISGHVYEVEYTATAYETLTVFTSTPYTYYTYANTITQITDPKIGYGSPVVPKEHLPAMTQIEFVKMICNLFGLIPEVNTRQRSIRFWNYNDLYANVPRARDWSAYLSERDDEITFKFGDYAQRNYLRYKDCDDVLKDGGSGVLAINDLTLPQEKDVVALPLSTCDEVIILTDVRVAQIDFNKYNDGTGAYDQNESVDGRLVYVSQVPEDLAASPPYQKTFGLRDSLSGGISYDTVNPYKASTIEIAFSTLITQYAALATMLTKTKLRRCKFNLPAYEVAGFRHDIPIYLNQYRAYFYVNKINNYVVGKLCTVDLIKL